MFQSFHDFVKALPSLILSFILALTVWVAAVTEADPTEERSYPLPISIEIIGQDPGLLITNTVPSKLTLNLSAPQSIWQKLTRDQVSVRAIADLSGLSSGNYEVPVQVQVGIRPVKVVSYYPQTVTVALESIATRNLPIQLVQTGDVAVGFEAGESSLSQNNASVTGSESRIRQVDEIRATLKMNAANKNIVQSINLQALDANDAVVEGVTVSPASVTVTQEINQRGGYRNVVVKVNLKGQVANGYHITNISVYPPVVTVYSADQSRVDALPGYVDTSDMVLTDTKEDIDERLSLILPAGISVVGDQFVQAHVSVASIESSMTLSGMPVEVSGLSEDLQANVSPSTVDVIISGPVPMLSQLTRRDVRVVVDLSGQVTDSNQYTPSVEIKVADLKVQSIIPGSVDINIVKKSDLTPVAPTRLPTATNTPEAN